jgi:iron complex outermembrane receptor protein
MSAVLFGLAQAVVGVSQAAAAPTTAHEQFHLDIERTQLTEALKKIGEQTGLQIARFSDTEPVNLLVGPLSGSYTREQALRALLQGTGLTYRFVNDRTVAIIKEAPPPPSHTSQLTISSPDQRAPSVTPDTSSDQKARDNEDSNDTGDEKMKRHGLLSRLLAFFTACSIGVLANGPACAQGAQSGIATTTGEDTGQALQEIVVTGTTEAQKILDTSFAITTIDSETLKDSPAISLPALLSSVPGIYSESSGGEENLNISARGLRGGFLEYLSLQEDGLPLVYNGFLEELQHRKDIMDDSLQIVRGGPSGVLTTNGAAAIINFITRRGTDTPHGEATVSYWDFGQVRTDFYYGGPLGQSTTFSAGGYWEVGDGVKSVGYQADRGGQFRFLIDHKIENGDLWVSYKHVDAHSQFYLPQPVQLNQVGKITHVSPIPGFNAESDYLAGPDTENVLVKTPNGATESINLRDGITEQSDTVTLHGEYNFQNGLKWSDTARIVKDAYVDNDLRNLGSNSAIFTAESFLTGSTAASLIGAFAPKGAVGAELTYATSGAVITNPATLNGNGLLVEQGANQYAESMDEIINDDRLTWDIANNSATIGLLTWSVQMNVFQNAVNYLLDVKNNAHLINMTAVNAAGKPVGYLTDNGVLSYDNGYGSGTVDMSSNSFYINDQYHPFEPLRVDAGWRYERLNQASTSENTASAALGGVINPNIVADTTPVTYGNGTYTHGISDFSASAWTAGANYELTPNLAFYGRYSSAIDTGINNFAIFSPGSSGLPTTATRLDFGEFGIRLATPVYYLELTAFRSVNNHIEETESNTGQLVFLNNIAQGIEYDAKYHPIPEFTAALTGVVQKSYVTSFNGTTALTGDQIDRLPDLQIHFTPTVSDPSGRASAYAQISYYSRRWGDLANTLEFAAYTNVDAGVSFKATPYLTLAVQGTNLTNVFSLTEGNPRGNAIIAGTNAYGFARANLPRVIMATVDLRF